MCCSVPPTIREEIRNIVLEGDWIRKFGGGSRQRTEKRQKLCSETDGNLLDNECWCFFLGERMFSTPQRNISQLGSSFGLRERSIPKEMNFPLLDTLNLTLSLHISTQFLGLAINLKFSILPNLRWVNSDLLQENCKLMVFLMVQESYNRWVFVNVSLCIFFLGKPSLEKFPGEMCESELRETERLHKDDLLKLDLRGSIILFFNLRGLKQTLMSSNAQLLAI